MQGVPFVIWQESESAAISIFEELGSLVIRLLIPSDVDEDHEDNPDYGRHSQGGYNDNVDAGLHKLWHPGVLAARKWRENEKMKRKWRENEKEMERE